MTLITSIIFTAEVLTNKDFWLGQVNGQYKKATKDFFVCLFCFTSLGNIDFPCFDLVIVIEIQQAYVAKAANQTIFLRYG